MADILLHRVAQHTGVSCLSLLRVHISQLRLVGHKAQLSQHTRHIRRIQHLEQLPLNRTHRAPALLILRLHYSRHHLAVLAVRKLQILNVGAHHRRRILIRHIDQLLLVVVIERTLVVSRLLLALTHNQRLGTLNGCRSRSIGVNRDKKVALGLVCDVCSCRQILIQRLSERGIRLAGIYHLNRRQLLLDKRSEFQRNGQIYILLLYSTIHSTRESGTSVTGINDNNSHPCSVILSEQRSGVHHHTKKQKQTEEYMFHIKSAKKLAVIDKKTLYLSVKTPHPRVRRSPYRAVLPTCRQRYKKLLTFWVN